ncbi:cyclic GMP-AMP synthase-like receptor [Mytilus edulis]|uniref:cyclic GMP-AMP synthase-like receptor n=1 Tax=Mytilus edulis TaxID=6550 RepID=UPI0039EF8248
MVTNHKPTCDYPFLETVWILIMSTKDELSLTLYHYLSRIIGAEDIVKTRQNTFKVMDFVMNDNDGFTFISSGSKAEEECLLNKLILRKEILSQGVSCLRAQKFGNVIISTGSRAEGLDLKGSDFDVMNMLDDCQVHENINNVINGPLKVPILMETNDTKPGFTKLKVYPIFNRLPILSNMVETLGEETFISSKRFRESFLSPGQIIHGPCLSDSSASVDVAICLRCKEWITIAQPWIKRPRSTWPDYKVIASIVQYGVLFVPIGYKHSPNENMEWRISFSMAEKQLIYSFSHTQLLCYALLKIILKDIIKPKHGDLICSYFLKTIMFWLSEESYPSDWKPESFLSCFLNCLRRLNYCVEYKTCLHYFIPEYNLFEDRFTDDQQVTLLNTLQLIYISPWTEAIDRHKKRITDLAKAEKKTDGSSSSD